MDNEMNTNIESVEVVENNRSLSTGIGIILLAATGVGAIAIGAYKGVKWIIKKIKGNKKNTEVVESEVKEVESSTKK